MSTPVATTILSGVLVIITSCDLEKHSSNSKTRPHCPAVRTDSVGRWNGITNRWRCVAGVERGLVPRSFLARVLANGSDGLDPER